MQKLLAVYIDCAKKASRDLIRDWTVIPGMFVLYLGVLFIGQISAPLGMAGGFLMGFAFIAALAYYYQWVRRSLDREKLGFADLKEFDSALFFQVMSIAFIFWIVLDLILGSASAGSGDNTIRLVAQLAAFVLFNAIPEVLYQQRNEGMEALIEAFNFVRDNWLEWFLPFLVVLAAPLILLPPEYMITAVASSRPLMPFFIILETWPFANSQIVPGLLGAVAVNAIPIVLCHWYMLFRGHLFEAITRGRLR